jgi:DNA-binding PadR family transcriptional regulator
MSLSRNERAVLGVLADKQSAEPVDCAHLADVGLGLADAALRSLVNKGLATANTIRKGLSKKPDGTYSITELGRTELAHH